MNLSAHLDRAKVELADAYTALEQAQIQYQAIQQTLRQCELKKIAAEAKVQAYADLVEPPAPLTLVPASGEAV